MISHGLQQAGVFLLDVGIKGALWLMAVAAVERCFHRPNASWRNLMWRIGVVGLLVIPFSLALLPRVCLPILPQQGASLNGMNPTPLTHLPVYAPPSGNLPSRSILVAAPRREMLAAPQGAAQMGGLYSWRVLAVGVYAAGVCGVLLRLLVASVQVSALRRSCRPITDPDRLNRACQLRIRLGICREVGLATSSRVRGPTQVGFLAPIVVIPTSVLQQTHHRAFETIVAHEFAHVYRQDYLFNLISTVAFAMHWWNPLSWLAVQRLRETSELACDDWSVELLGDADSYADTLLELAALVGARRELALGMSVITRSRIARRITRVVTLGGRISPRTGRSAASFAAAGLLMGALLLGVAKATERQSQKPRTGHESLEQKSGLPTASQTSPAVSLSTVPLPEKAGDLPYAPTTQHVAAGPYPPGKLTQAPRKWRSEIGRDVETAQLLGSLSRVDGRLRRSMALRSLDLEPNPEAGEMGGDTQPQPAADKATELKDLRSLDTGKHHAVVVQDSNDRRNVWGFCRLSCVHFSSLDKQAPGDVGNGQSMVAGRLVRETIQNLVYGLNKYSAINAHVGRSMATDDPGISQVPWLYHICPGSYELGDRELNVLGRYMEQGGLVFADCNASETYTGATSHRKALLGALETQRRRASFQRLTPSHPLYHSYFDFTALPAGADAWLPGSREAGRTAYLEGLELEGRLVAVLSKKGYFVPWSQARTKPGFERQLQFGVNLIVFALTQEGSTTRRAARTLGY